MIITYSGADLLACKFRQSLQRLRLLTSRVNCPLLALGFRSIRFLSSV